MRLARSIALLAPLLALLWAQDTQAQPKLAVRPFAGPQGARFRAAVVQALEKGRTFELVPDARVKRAARALRANLKSEEGRAAVARELSLSALIEGRVRRRGHNFELELRVYRGANGALAGEPTLEGRRPGLLGKIRRRLQSDLVRMQLDEAEPEPDAVVESPPVEAEPEPVEEPEPEPEQVEPEQVEEEPASAERRAQKPAPVPEPEVEPEPELELDGPPAFELAASLRLLTRDFGYNDSQARLAEQRWQPTPAGRLALGWYPGAHAGRGVGGWFGLQLQAQLMLPIDAVQGPSVFTTESRALSGGLRIRIPLSDSELGLYAGYGAHEVTIGDSQFGGDPEVPSVSYRYARFGIDTRIAFSRSFAISLRAAYLWLHRYGEIADVRWFPHTSGGGLEGELEVAYALADPLWIEASFGLVRYFLSFHPQSTDPSVVVMRRIAGGAIDQQLSGALGLGLRL